MEIRNPEVCNAMFGGEHYVNMLLGLEEEFPKIGALIGFVNFCDAPVDLVADSIQRYEHANNKGVIRFNKHNLTEANFAYWQSQPPKQANYAVPTPAGFAAHEFAHFMYWFIEENHPQYIFRQLAQAHIGQFHTIAPKISLYASTSRQECFCELMAIYLTESPPGGIRNLVESRIFGEVVGFGDSVVELCS